MLEEVADRGLLFLDGRAGQKVLPRAWNRSADMVVDGDPLEGYWNWLKTKVVVKGGVVVVDKR